MSNSDKPPLIWWIDKAPHGRHNTPAQTFTARLTKKHETDILVIPASDAHKYCERCSDIFYHPKTVIEDMKQSAAEWEDVAKRAEETCAKLKAELSLAKQDRDSWKRAHQVCNEAGEAVMAERDKLKAELDEARAEIVKMRDHSQYLQAANHLVNEAEKLKGENTQLKSLALEMRDVLRGVISVADRQTVEFDKARSALTKANEVLGE